MNYLITNSLIYNLNKICINSKAKSLNIIFDIK